MSNDRMSGKMPNPTPESSACRTRLRACIHGRTIPTAVSGRNTMNQRVLTVRA